MKIFTNEFEDRLVKAIGYGLMIGLVVLVFGIVSGIEQGLIW
jgi:predicted cobalt transporter CbtA